jgi:hypothetical protein
MTSVVALTIPNGVLVPVIAIVGLWLYARRCWRMGGHLGKGLMLDLIAIACLIAALQILVGQWAWPW